MTIWAYVRESTSKQELGLAAQIKELKKSGYDTLVQDKGQSGATNLTESDNWAHIRTNIRSGDILKVWSQSRLGRTSYEVQYVVGKLIEMGVEVQVIETQQLFNDLDVFAQNLNLTFKSLVDHNERVEIKARTNKAIGVLKDAGVKLGREPKLANDDITLIQNLRDKGLGYASISKIVEVRDKHGKVSNPSVPTIKKVLQGSYTTKEDWLKENAKARTRLAIGGRK